MSVFDKKELSGSRECAFSSRVRVRFDDVDAAGVVYFARVLSIVHEAYEGFLDECGEPLSRVLSSGKWAAPILHAEADYFRPLRLGDELRVELVAARRGGSRLSLGWCLRSEDSVGKGRAPVVHAVVQMVHVFISPSDGSPCAVPETILEALGQMLESPPSASSSGT